MFNFFRKEVKNVIVNSPVNGEVFHIENVEDSMFANKLLGNGVAFKLNEDTVYAPCAGEVIMIATTKHALGIRTENGAELLIHVGLNTVNLNGRGFELYVESNQKIKKGMPLIKIDRELMLENNIDLTTPMIITNGDLFKIDIDRNEGVVSLSNVVFQISSL